MNTGEINTMSSDDIVLSNQIDTCIVNGDVDNLKKMLDEHGDMLHKTIFGTGYHGILNFAAKEGHVEICKLLVERGIPVDICPRNNHTPLDEAATNGHLEACKWFLANGASIDALPSSTVTPLMSAITMGHVDIAKFLIENGADINRLHLRLNQTPLDLAIIWGREDIAALLRSRAAVSTLSEPDWSEEYGGSIIQFINDSAGRVLPIQLTKLVGEKTIDQRIAIVNKGKQKMLFTVGLFAIHKPMLELALVLPADWNLHDKSNENQFPTSLLLLVCEQIKAGLKIDEGYCIQSSDPLYGGIKWPPNVMGFCVCNHNWGRDNSNDSEIESEDQVNLWTLIPVKANKKGFPVQSIEKNRALGWGKLTLIL